MTRKQTTSILLLVASVIYAMIPTDLIPDVPFIGWMDDTLVTSSAAINCLQQFSDGENKNGSTNNEVVEMGVSAIGCPDNTCSASPVKPIGISSEIKIYT